MLSRNRTDDFNSYNGFSAIGFNDNNKLLKSHTIIDIQLRNKNIISRNWIQAYDSFLDEHKKLTKYILVEHTECCKLSNKTQFSSNVNYEEELKKINEHIEIVLIKLKNVIDKFQKIYDSDKPESEKYSNSELNIINNIKSYFLILFADLKKIWIDTGFSYEKEKDRKKNFIKQMSLTYDHKNNDNVNVNVNVNVNDFFVSSTTISEETKNKIKFDSDMANEHHKEIIELTKSVKSVHQIFADVFEIVEIQGTILNTINDNIGKAQIDIERGTKTLKQTEVHSNWFLPCICLLVIIILILIIIVSINISSKNSSNNNKTKS
jgi:t-SNARE complex subunit (syntaxin)